MHEGSLCVPGAAGRRPAGPACGDLGPELCTGQSRGRHGAQRRDFVLRSPPPLHLAPGASSKFCLWRSCSLDCRGHASLLPACGASELSPPGQAGRSMSTSFPSSTLENLHGLCVCPLCPEEGAP